MRLLNIVILAALLLIVGALPSYANPLLIVENIRVDVTGDNALAARDKAFEEAQVQAFKEVATRLVPSTPSKNIVVPDIKQIAAMVRDFEITNEKLSDIRYIGVYTFRFWEAPLRRYFSQDIDTSATSESHLPRNNKGPASTLVLPFFKQGYETILWSDDNPWLSAWQTTQTDKDTMTLVVPLGDLNDLRDISGRDVFNYDVLKMNRIRQRYNAEEVIFAVAEENNGRIDVNIYTGNNKTDTRPTFLSRISALPDETMDQNTVLRRAIEKVKTALTDRLRPDPDTTTHDMKHVSQNVVPIRVSFQNLRQWNGTYNALKRVPGIGKVTLQSIKQTAAKISLQYQGHFDDLQATLKRSGFSIHPSSQSTAAGVPSAAKETEIIYDVYLDRYATHYIQSF